MKIHVYTADAGEAQRKGTCRWDFGDTSSRSFFVPITDDRTYEESETFSVELSSPTGGATLTFATLTNHRDHRR